MTLTKGRIERTGRVAFHDASLSVWEEGIPREWDAKCIWERQFKRDVFARIVQTLKRLGWTCAMPEIKPHDVKHYGGNVARWSAESKRFCTKGDLKADLDISGRCIKFEMFQNVNAPDRSDHDGRYQYDKEKHMPYLLRLEMERARRRIRDYLCNVFTGYEFEQPHEPKMGLLGITAVEKAAHSRRTSGHYKPHLDRADYGMACNTRAADGGTIEHGAKIWAIGRKGRLITGTAYYSLNNNWQIVTGRYDLTYAHTGEIFTRKPENLRVKRNGRDRRRRLESELQKAIAAMNFERAAVLRDILFPGNQPLFNVWHEEHQLYHCSNFSGYTKDQSKAGKFTADEVRGWDKAPNKVIALERMKEAA
ncbi:UvrB/UvrC motif-containing protein [Noviherbaspirillum saxi]|uniref:UVR domain-containing protein n=1 Tax=Noviherbaspirillum saxi TaxID=2320863 RepID=A0A3A3FUR8_9BURK|nr:UvrB/UvrC motif-containing protein [Noviherbaspirillum saxi]RJF99064.1 hypothetical protein D3871_11470 [Noviherbaspirillum saxi]